MATYTLVSGMGVGVNMIGASSSSLLILYTCKYQGHFTLESVHQNTGLVDADKDSTLVCCEDEVSATTLTSV